MTIMTCWPVAAVVDRILKVHAAPEGVVREKFGSD